MADNSASAWRDSGEPETATTTATPASKLPTGAAPARHRRALIAVSTLLVLAGVAVAVVLLTRTDPAADKLADSAPALQSTLAALSEADSTKDVRKLAAATAGTATDLSAFADSLPSESPAAADLRLVAAALVAVASLDKLAGDNPKPWSAAEKKVRALADHLRTEAVAVADIQGNASQAADQVDKVLAKSKKAYRKWKKANARAIRVRDAAVAAASTYRDRMRQYIAEYKALRRELSQYVDEVNSVGSTVDVAYAVMADAASGRRAVRRNMASLDPPDAVASAHTAMIRIIDDGIAGIESAQRGLDERNCGYYYCDVTEQPAWLDFRAESKRISAALDRALARWTAEAKQAVAEARATELPDRPAF